MTINGKKYLLFIEFQHFRPLKKIKIVFSKKSELIIIIHDYIKSKVKGKVLLGLRTEYYVRANL